MHATLEVLDRPGSNHPYLPAGPQTLAQSQWLDETCALIEAFASHAELDLDARLVASLAIHLAADFLFLRHEADASWARLEPGALAASLVGEMSARISDILHALSAFYCFLAATTRMDSRRGWYIAGYFATLATLDDGSFMKQARAGSYGRARKKLTASQR